MLALVKSGGLQSMHLSSSVRHTGKQLVMCLWIVIDYWTHLSSIVPLGVVSLLCPRLVKEAKILGLFSIKDCTWDLHNAYLESKCTPLLPRRLVIGCMVSLHMDNVGQKLAMFVHTTRRTLEAWKSTLFFIQSYGRCWSSRLPFWGTSWRLPQKFEHKHINKFTLEFRIYSSSSEPPPPPFTDQQSYPCPSRYSISNGQANCIAASHVQCYLLARPAMHGTRNHNLL